MSDDHIDGDSTQPTLVRHVVLTAATLMSVLLYLDRYAVTIPLEYIREDLRMTQHQVAWFVSAFFWSYALGQVPAGWLSDRFGARLMLTIYITIWSLMTGLMGISHAIWMLLWLRVVCGIFQAGAYPTAGGMIRHWYPTSQRGTASSIVGLGGRFGVVVAQILTAALIVHFVAQRPAPRLTVANIVNEDLFLSRFVPNQIFEPADPLGTLHAQFAMKILDLTLPLDREAIGAAASAAESSRQDERSRAVAPKSANFTWRDWIPDPTNVWGTKPPPTSPALEALVRTISTQMEQLNFYEMLYGDARAKLKLPAEAQALAEQWKANQRLSAADTILWNRWVLEALYPQEIQKARGFGWRPTLVVYGAIGIAVALGFYAIVRNSPATHPWCNAAEVRLINDSTATPSNAPQQGREPFPWRAFLFDLSLWGNGSTQFLTNVGWFFAVNSLPRYLETVHHVPLFNIAFYNIGVMTAFPMAAGILGLFSGGRCTDWAAKSIGLKWGRRLPVVASRFTAAAGYGLCIALSLTVEPSPEKHWLPWLYVLGLSLAAASTDFGSPAIWAFAQDVGGRYTGSILGWGNMWGNFGAAVAPLLYNAILGEHPQLGQWTTVFTACCLAFLLAGLCGLLLDATRPLTSPRSVSARI